VQFTKPRYVRRDIELGGVRLRRGAKVMVMLAAANIDPQANVHPERLDLLRKPNRHIASAPASIFASVISSHASRGSARSNRYSPVGRN